MPAMGYMLGTVKIGNFPKNPSRRCSLKRVLSPRGHQHGQVLCRPCPVHTVQPLKPEACLSPDRMPGDLSKNKRMEACWQGPSAIPHHLPAPRRLSSQVLSSAVCAALSAWGCRLELTRSHQDPAAPVSSVCHPPGCGAGARAAAAFSCSFCQQVSQATALGPPCSVWAPDKSCGSTCTP